MEQDHSSALVVLAALLHDVGKFAQRAGAPDSKNMEHEFCPFDQKTGRHTHKHVLYTDYFIENDLGLPPELESKRSYLARLASTHHKPGKGVYEEECLCLADRLSSGGDRIAGDSEGDYKKARLESVFSSLRLGDAEAPKDLRYRLLPLDDETRPAIFPVEDHQEPSYADLYEDFKTAIKKIPLDMGITHYIHSLATVFERYTWCIPSSTYKTKADISLYDHSWTTATIAQALLRLKESTDTPKKLLLYGGDLSGIQNYIFGTEDISGKGANKLLRARSFLLQALLRSIWTELLERLSLHGVAKIMDAGGRFVLLLPSNDAVKSELEKLEHDVEKYMLEEFQGILRLTFASLEIGTNDLERTRFNDCFDNFNDELERAKLRPFHRLMANHVSPVLAVNHADYAAYGECVACRMRPASSSNGDAYGDAFDGDDGKNICASCDILINKIGRHLPTAHYMLLERGSGGLPLFGGLSLRLLQQKELKPADRKAVDIVNMQDYKAFSALPFAGHIPVIDEERDIKRWEEEKRLKEGNDGFTFAGEECKADMPKTFAMLAQESCIQKDGKWRSISNMAVCKADVDNLGLLFGIGFGVGEKSSFSISRFAMLSRMLNHFFASHLTRTIEKEFPDIYVVFAGGDDLFVLGPWADIVYFSKRMQEDFKAFSGGHPDLTLCAGISLFKPRLPMRGIRTMAEETEKQSKNYPDKADPSKNAVTLFDVTAPWEEFSSLFAQGEWLEKLCLDGTISQGLVRRLLGYARECKEFKQNGDIKKGLYLSHMAYDFARNCDEKRMDSEDLKKLKQLGQETTFPKSSMGITWALYRTRTSTQE